MPNANERIEEQKKEFVDMITPKFDEQQKKTLIQLKDWAGAMTPNEEFLAAKSIAWRGYKATEKTLSYAKSQEAEGKLVGERKDVLGKLLYRGLYPKLDERGTKLVEDLQNFSGCKDTHHLSNYHRYIKELGVDKVAEITNAAKRLQQEGALKHPSVYLDKTLKATRQTKINAAIEARANSSLLGIKSLASEKDMKNATKDPENNQLKKQTKKNKKAGMSMQ